MTESLSFEQLLSAGRYRLSKAMPYLESALLWLVPIETEAVATMGVSKSGLLKINRQFVMRQSPVGVATLLGHEVCHVLLYTIARAERLGSTDPRVYYVMSLAADLVINVLLRDAGLPVTSVVGGGVMPADFGFPEGLTTEDYYVRLVALIDEPDGGGGSCMHGLCTTTSDDKQDRDLGRSEASLERIQRQVAHAVRATQAASDAWQRFADDILTPPQVSWEQQLASIVRHHVSYQAGRLVCYDGRARKQCAGGFGLGRPVLPRYLASRARVEVWLDTSGSMSNSDLAQGLSELPAIVRLTGAEVLFGVIDTEIRALTPVRTVEDARACLRGGGGTDFTALFARLETLPVHERPDLVIFTTDGEAFGVPESPPPCKVVWLCVRGGRPPCRWGHTIDLGAQTRAA